MSPTLVYVVTEADPASFELDPVYDPVAVFTEQDMAVAFAQANPTRVIFPLPLNYGWKLEPPDVPLRTLRAVPPAADTP